MTRLPDCQKPTKQDTPGGSRHVEPASGCPYTHPFHLSISSEMANALQPRCFTIDFISTLS